MEFYHISNVETVTELVLSDKTVLILPDVLKKMRESLKLETLKANEGSDIFDQVEMSLGP